MKTYVALLISWLFAFVGALASIYIVFWNVKQSDLLGQGSILFAIACAVIPFCAATALSKLVEYFDKIISKM